MPTLHLMVGLPGAGKTTRAREIERQGALRLTPDEWMESLDIEPSDERRRAAIEALQWRVAARALELGIDVILDFGFWSRDERDDFRQRAGALGAATAIHYMDASRDELFARNAARRADAKLGAYAASEAELDRWIGQFEPPAPDELSPPHR